MSMKDNSNKRQKGFSMIELLAVIVVGAMFVLIAAQLASRGIDAGDQKRLENDIDMLRIGASEWKGHRPSYSGVNCDYLLEFEYVKAPSWNGTCNGANPKGGNYTVTAASPESNLTITAANLSTSLCTRTARQREETALSASCSSGTLTIVYEG